MEVPVPKNAKQPPPRIQIARPAPMIDCGRYPAKRTIGDTVGVSADIFADGHDVLRAVVRHSAPGSKRWEESPLVRIDAHVDGDRWAGGFTVDALGPPPLDDRGLGRCVRELARRASA